MEVLYMNLKQVKLIGVLLQIAFLISIFVLLYFEKMNYLWLELGLVAVMFCISMCMLLVSENEDEQRVNEKVKVRN
jgi:L-asparagine transporter-like permease